MLNRITYIARTIRNNQWRWLAITLGTVVIYYAILMASLVLRFGNLPNYINLYEWWQNVLRIIESTPSIKDSIKIIQDEWLLEIGYMNYEFGLGISEWSLFIVPVKVLGVTLLGALIATNYLLIHRTPACARSSLSSRSSDTATGLGAGLVAIASVTLSWVVCCSTPTWVVGLAMLGLGASTALWLEPLGSWLNGIGFIILLVVCYVSAKPLTYDHQRLEELS
ncbi:MAG: hypothetical protein CMK83_05220 [Pseudomonadales bacterium]|jgi:hypothetical protein|uniref:hypothetical protein n=1 Tax=unclassified Ketobacter TaxID=2639109 RepID=UPI000C8EB19C|nr:MULTISPECIES: hypothetical protein [unclassified Ketobacter]MAA60262.1 hypothetical protein [Pseudomonadales bacterium]MEC8812835.1 hypothetical protein [Pseudomonadota bacterium]TNC90800.1 MAG: hypothetical protein CSH49_01295 [Alcanivorax sp.]HAG92655.1 hypothetical protein [Gammaproteobacteria bacterium]MAQ23599.1 hypothetical protein [Pseudomonadales bacterium]|tara:strand:- start:31351 stop:32019 length:669 start_codon:yes stop_codon:yes gene_type:complete